MQFRVGGRSPEVEKKNFAEEIHISDRGSFQVNVKSGQPDTFLRPWLQTRGYTVRVISIIMHAVRSAKTHVNVGYKRCSSMGYFTKPCKMRILLRPIFTAPTFTTIIINVIILLYTKYVGTRIKPNNRNK